MTEKTTPPKGPSEAAVAIVRTVNQYIVWGKSPDEALQVGINDVFDEDTSEEYKAGLFAFICEAGVPFEAGMVQAAMDKAL